MNNLDGDPDIQRLIFDRQQSLSEKQTNEKRK
jgi:hypothetical protein